MNFSFYTWLFAVRRYTSIYYSFIGGGGGGGEGREQMEMWLEGPSLGYPEIRATQGGSEGARIIAHSCIKAVVSIGCGPGSGWHRDDDDGGGGVKKTSVVSCPIVEAE